MRASKQQASTRRKNLWVALALCAITLLAYSNSFSAGFTFDNHGLILEDARIREASDANLRLIVEHTYWWPYGESGLYRPLTTLSYLFNYVILGNGDQPAGYHAVNFLLHFGNVLLVLLLARKLLGSEWPPVFIAALWAVHPVLTESVTNIVGRADLLAGGATLGGFLIYLKSAEKEGRRRWAWLGGLMLATCAGVFSKESAVTVLGAERCFGSGDTANDDLLGTPTRDSPRLRPTAPPLRLAQKPRSERRWRLEYARRAGDW